MTFKPPVGRGYTGEDSRKGASGEVGNGGGVGEGTSRRKFGTRSSRGQHNHDEIDTGEESDETLGKS